MTAAAGGLPIGYYVHHHGAGHGAHGVALGRVLGDRLVGLGSGPIPNGWHSEWIPLPRDDRPEAEGDPTRHGAWHWLPHQHQGFTQRMRAIASWIAGNDPAVLVSDVSAEVVALSALLGVPSVAVLLAGRRTDRPHRTAFDTAEAIVAPWPEAHRQPWHEPWAAKIRHVGLLSRFEDRTAGDPDPDGRILVILPAGGHTFDPSAIEEAAKATGRRWDVVGAVPRPAVPNLPTDRFEQGGSGPTRERVGWHGEVDDLWPLLVAASVVVGAAGSATVADIAAARRPAVLFAQDRPFGEQLEAVYHLERTAPVTACRAWPCADAWPAMIESTAALDGRRWSELHDGRAGERFAEALCSLA